MLRRLSTPTFIVLAIFAAIFPGLVVPASSVSYQLHPIIIIDGNASFTAANGVSSGTGTRTNPYIIENWNITHFSNDVSNFYAIVIRNTNAYFTIRNVYLCGVGTSSIGVYFNNVTNGQLQTANIPNCARSTTGIYIMYSHNLTIYNNVLPDSRSLFLSYSSNLTVSANEFIFQCSSCAPTYVWNIVDVEHSNNSIFSSNNLFGGSLHLSFSKGVLVYHNNFLNLCDTCTVIGGGVDNQGNLNSWDNGYPSGGNYWTNFTGLDRCSGPAQNICQGPDGIGDTPYILGNVTDHYPMMRAYGDTTPPVWGARATLLATDVSQSTVHLGWSGATDDLGMAGYRIYQNGQFLTATGRDRYGAVAESYTVLGLQPGATYNFKVLAVDVANNTSAGGTSIDVTTIPQWGQVTSLVWWQNNWFYVAALIGSGVAIMAWVVIRRGRQKQKHLTDFSKSNFIPVTEAR